MPRSLRLAKNYLDRAQFALIRKGYCSQKMLAEDINLSRTTISRFFNGHPISIVNFCELCNLLNLSWEEVVDWENN